MLLVGKGREKIKEKKWEGKDKKKKEEKVCLLCLRGHPSFLFLVGWLSG